MQPDDHRQLDKLARKLAGIPPTGFYGTITLKIEYKDSQPWKQPKSIAERFHQVSK